MTTKEFAIDGGLDNGGRISMPGMATEIEVAEWETITVRCVHVGRDWWAVMAETDDPSVRESIVHTARHATREAAEADYHATVARLSR